MGNISTAVSYAVKIANDDTHGYDQASRLGNPDYDCSSFVSACLNKAGFNVSKSSTTRNLYTQLTACGFKPVGIGESRKAGDIFLTPGKHVVMCTDANNIVQASINEKGTATGGKAGDQTGREIAVSKFYTPSYGWTYHLRYGTSGSSTASSGTCYTVGKTYTLQAEMKVRKDHSLSAKMVGYSNLTADGKKHDKDKDGCLDKGTVVTCKSVYEASDYTWMKTPSGWIAAYNKSTGERYIK